MNMDFELKMDQKTMSRFLLRYNYAKPSGVFGVLLGLGSLVLVLGWWGMWTANQRVVWLVIAALFLIIQPVTLVIKGKRQLEQLEDEDPLFCHIDDEGLVVTQGEASSECKWEDVRKVVYGKDVIYVFTSAISATIITADACGDGYHKLVTFLKEKKKR